MSLDPKNEPPQLIDYPDYYPVQIVHESRCRIADAQVTIINH